MPGPRQPRNKKTAPRAADGLRRPLSAEELRRQAEERLDGLSAAASAAAASPMPEELAAAVHELRVHQIELEMQNEELRRAQLELDAQREKYFELFDLAPVGYLTLSDEGIVGEANSTAAHLLGDERQQLVGQPFSAFVFAPDRDAYYLHLRKLEKTGAPQTCELRLQPVGGEPFWGRLESQPQDASGSEPLRCRLTFTDVNERVLAEEALREASLYSRNLIETSLDPLVTISAEGMITDVNTATERITGRSRERLIGSDFTDYFTEPEMARAGYLQAFSAGQVIDYPLAIRHSSGAVTEVLYNASVYRDEQGVVLGVFAAARDITAQKRAGEEIQQRNQELARLNAELVAEAAALAEAHTTITRIAATDDLTGLANRRHFYEALENAVSLARRHGYPLALVSLDLDGLKRVNDTLGHEAGDEVLASFATLLAALCRAEDLPARLGGDELSVLLPGMELDGAQGLAERLLTAVRACEALVRRGVTVSAGVVQWAPGELPDDLLRRADEALYAAKRVGGDAAAVDG